MTFSIWDYAFYSAVIPITIAVAALLIAFYFARKIALVKNKIIVLSLPLILWGVLFIAWLYYGIIVTEGCTYPLTPVFESKAPVHTTVGEVTNISNAPSPPKYYNKSTHSFETAKFIEVNGVRYYALSADLEEGDLVRIKWMTVENVVLSYEEITAEEYAVSEKPPYPTEESDFHAPLKVIEPDIMTFKNIIHRICLSEVAVFVAAQYLLGSKMAYYLEEKDRKVFGEVKRNFFGLWYSMIPTLGVYGLLLTGFRTALPIMILGVVTHGIIVLKKLTTRIKVYGDTLFYRCLFTKKHYKISDISKIYWGKANITNTRKLIVTFQGSYLVSLEQEWYWGLENFYNYVLEVQSNTIL